MTVVVNLRWMLLPCVQCTICVKSSFCFELPLSVQLNPPTHPLPLPPSIATSVSMETPEPGPADGEEHLVELRPRTRSNPEGAEDRRSSTGSLGGISNPNVAQPAVGSRVEGEGEASTNDSPLASTTATLSVAAVQNVAPVATAALAAAASGATVPLSAAAIAAKERPKPTQQQQQQPAMTTPILPPADYQLRVPRVNCPEKVVCQHVTADLLMTFETTFFAYSDWFSSWQIICLDLSEEMSLLKLESFNG